MKRLYTLFMVMINLCVSLSQTNLIPNPSFEIHDSCPPNMTFLYLASPWFQPSKGIGNTNVSCSSDLFSACSDTGIFSVCVPVNVMGNQSARTGNSYAGIIMCVLVGYTDAREYIEVPLLSALVAGSKYCLQFYVSLSEASGCATSNVSAFFSQDSLIDTTYFTINRIPQIENPNMNMLNDKNAWIEISGDFIASGGEKFLTIGNFRDNANSNYELSISSWGAGWVTAYYYIDDLSLILCDKPVNLNDAQSPKRLQIYPNPATDILYLSFGSVHPDTFNITNILGKEVLSSKIAINEVSIDISNIQSGIYFITLCAGQEREVLKFIKE